MADVRPAERCSTQIDGSTGVGGPPSSGAESVLDRSILDRSVIDQLVELDDGRTSLLGELVSLYSDSVVTQMGLLDAAIASGDAVGIARVAHAISGSSATLGASRMASLARRLERLASGGVPDEALVLAAGIRAEAASTLGALVEVVESAGWTSPDGLAPSLAG